MATRNKTTEQMDANPKELPEGLFEAPARQTLHLSNFLQRYWEGETWTIKLKLCSRYRVLAFLAC